MNSEHNWQDKTNAMLQSLQKHPQAEIDINPDTVFRLSEINNEEDRKLYTLYCDIYSGLDSEAIEKAFPILSTMADELFNSLVTMPNSMDMQYTFSVDDYLGCFLFLAPEPEEIIDALREIVAKDFVSINEISIVINWKTVAMHLMQKPGHTSTEVAQ